MGKSRLVSEFAAEVHAEGARVLLGACHEDVDEPYGPFIEAIIDDASATRTCRTASGPGTSTDMLARLSPELARVIGRERRTGPSRRRRRLRAIDGDRRGQTVVRRRAPPQAVRCSSSRTSTGRRRRRGTSLRHLARRANRAPLLIVAHDPRHQARPRRRPGLAARRPRAVAVGLAASRSPDSARDEVGQLVGRAPRRKQRRSGPRPAAIRCSPPTWASDPGQRTPSGMAAPARRTARRRVPRRARHGGDVRGGVRRRSLAAAHGAPLLRVLESLEAAEAAGLVAPHPARAARFTFVHALFRAHRYDELPLRRRLELHGSGGRRAGARRRATTASSRSGHGTHASPSPSGTRARPSSWSAPPASGPSTPTRTTKRSPNTGAGSRRRRFLEPPDPDVISRPHGAHRRRAPPPRGSVRGLPMLLDAAREARETGDDRRRSCAPRLAIPQFGAVGFVDSMPEGRAVTEAALAALGPEPSPDACSSASGPRLALAVPQHRRGTAALAGRAEAIARNLGDPRCSGQC